MPQKEPRSPLTWCVPLLLGAVGSTVGGTMTPDFPNRRHTGAEAAEQNQQTGTRTRPDFHKSPVSASVQGCDTIMCKKQTKKNNTQYPPDTSSCWNLLHVQNSIICYPDHRVSVWTNTSHIHRWPVVLDVGKVKSGHFLSAI